MKLNKPSKPQKHHKQHKVHELCTGSFNGRVFFSPLIAALLIASSLQIADATAGKSHGLEEQRSHQHAEPEHDVHGIEEDDHAHGSDGGHGHDSHAEENPGVTEINPKQMALANIKVTPLTPQIMKYDVYAPGEIKANGYTSYLVSPRVDSVVSKRHATLGEHVTEGQALVTLFSADMGQAQADFFVNAAEWQRVKALGRKSVGDKRYISAKASYENSHSKLVAFGMSEAAINALSKAKSPSLGEYTLTAKIDGAVLSDNFNQGQPAAAGTVLMELANEAVLWIEARLPSNSQLTLPRGSKALIKVGGDHYSAEVVQEAHTIDPQTRTRIIRLLLNNDLHRLHPGMFADVYFQFDTEQPVLAVPEAALMRNADGHWTVFVEQDHAGEFKALEVELGRSLGQWREIEGVSAGTKVVTQGAFFVASQMAKGGFDPHNH